MIPITKHLGRYFSLISLISVLIITILSNVGMNIFFTRYLQNAQRSQDQTIVSYVEELAEQEGFTPLTLMGIEHYAFTMSAEVILEDLSGRVILGTSDPQGVEKGKTSREDYMDSSKSMYRIYPMVIEGSSQGSLLIGRPQSIFAVKEDRMFLLTINGIYLLAAMISLSIGFLLRHKVSGNFLRPIFAIQENTRVIERGAYDAVKPVSSRTIELNALSDSINTMALQLKEQEHLRRRLTADMAHELRTPLSTINSHLEAIIDGVWEATPERLAILQEEIARLTGLMKDLGDLNYLESGEIRLHVQEVDLTLLVGSVLENFHPIFHAQGKKLMAELQEGLMIKGDKDRLTQILVNLLSNGLKYTNSGGRVQVILKRSPQGILLEVRDDGIGISTQDLPFIFERLYRGDRSRSRESGGKGIGLTITRALVEAHDGRIWVTSEEGKGTSVFVELPEK